MIVCAKCNRGMRPKKNGVSFVEMVREEPYKLWMADLWECQDCGAQVLYTHPSQSPIAEQHQPNFKATIKSYSPEYRARDWSRD